VRHAIDLTFGIGWVAFWVGWLAAAVRVKSGRTRFGGYIGSRIAIAVLIVGLNRVHAFHGTSPHDTALDVVGLALWVSGLGFAIWARVYLGRNWGTPMSQKESPELVTSGPYRWVRNPIYSGIILALFGTALAVDLQWLIVAVLIGGYFVYSAVMEQRFMAEQFPDTYPAYRSSTKMLIPFVF
jgi:protein-S-isoprenylcysteine O-methyltransferase Ste14